MPRQETGCDFVFTRYRLRLKSVEELFTRVVLPFMGDYWRRILLLKHTEGEKSEGEYYSQLRW